MPRYKNSIISVSEVLVIREEEVGNRNKKLRVAQYRYSNGDVARILEKRPFYSSDGETRAGAQRMGFNIQDIDATIANYDKIRAALVIPERLLQESHGYREKMKKGEIKEYPDFDE